MESLSLEDKNMIKDIRNLFRLKKETKAIKDRIFRDIKNLFEHEEEENYYNAVKVSKFWSNSYIEYESNGDRNKTLSVKEYVNKIRPYLKDIMINYEADKVIKELFDSFKSTYQNNLELMKGSEFGFDYVHLLYYKCHKINLNRGGSSIDSPDWVKNKSTASSINKKDTKCFQYTVTVALNHEEIGKNLEKNNKN